LFIAIEIPRKLKREFSDLADSFRPREFDRVRWIEEDAMHLTLKFLGDTPIELIPDIETALELSAESTGIFTIKIGRTGCFPSFVDPRICWVGFTGELRRLEQLQGRVEGRMVALGLEEDDRDYQAHITVGRTRPGIRGRFAEDIGISWQHAPLRTTGQEVPVNAIALYRSYLDDKGDTQYQQLGNYPLG
jgi:2'-5' RNA ligase